MGRGISVLRVIFGAVVFVGVISFLSFGVFAARTTVVLKENSEHWDLIGRGRQHNNQDTNFHFVMKRRVPNGPDPIHNRRASLSRQPPGRT